MMQSTYHASMKAIRIIDRMAFGAGYLPGFIDPDRLA